MKRYRLPLSRVFPATHPRKGEPTYFLEQIQNAFAYQQGQRHEDSGILNQKLHTVRENVEYWANRIDNILAGKAALEVYEWIGVPYRKGSTTKTLFILDKDSGIGYQKIFIRTFDVGGVFIFDKDISVNSYLVARNDGLSLQDFKDWFRKSDLSKEKIIIHFTNFRY